MVHSTSTRRWPRHGAFSKAFRCRTTFLTGHHFLYVALPQLQSLRDRAEADAAAIERLQEAADALASERAAALQQAADACAVANSLQLVNATLERRAAAAEGFAAAVRRGAAFDMAEEGLAACADDAVQVGLSRVALVMP